MPEPPTLPRTEAACHHRSFSTNDALRTLELMLHAEREAVRIFFEGRHEVLLQNFSDHARGSGKSLNLPRELCSLPLKLDAEYSFFRELAKSDGVAVDSQRSSADANEVFVSEQSSQEVGSSVEGELEPYTSSCSLGSSGQASDGISSLRVAGRPRRSSKAKIIRRDHTGELYQGSKFAIVRWLEVVARSDMFEFLFGIMIILNSCVMCFEAQYWGYDSGYEVGFAGSRKASDVWPNAEIALRVLDTFFGITFTCEVIVKGIGLRVKFITSWWNLFDSIIIASWLMYAVVEILPVNPFFLRLMRLARLIRLLRLVRTIQVFDIVHLMAASLIASVYVLFWSVVLLVGIMTSAALIMVNVLDFYISDSSVNLASRVEAYKYFGNFSRSLLSVFELTLGNWVPLTRFLHEEVSEYFGIVIMVYHCVVSFAVVMVIRGVFLHETFQAAEENDELLILRQRRLKAKAISKMESLFREADIDEDGFLSRDEFTKVMTDTRVITWLAALGLEVRDVENMFEVIDDGDNYISAEEFISGFNRLKGPAKSIDMVQLLNLNRALGEIVQDIVDALGIDRKMQIERGLFRALQPEDIQDKDNLMACKPVCKLSNDVLWL